MDILGKVVSAAYYMNNFKHKLIEFTIIYKGI